MNYQLYQVVLFFAIYAIIGFFISILYRALDEGTLVNPRSCKGPYCPAYGIGALVMIFVMELIENDPPIAFGISLVIGSVLESMTLLLTRVVSGRWQGRFKWYHPLLWGAGGTILVTHLHQLIELATNRVSPWIHFGFLVVFLMVFISDYIDGIANFWEERKEKHQVKDN